MGKCRSWYHKVGCGFALSFMCYWSSWILIWFRFVLVAFNDFFSNTRLAPRIMLWVFWFPPLLWASRRSVLCLFVSICLKTLVCRVEYLFFLPSFTNCFRVRGVSSPWSEGMFWYRLGRVPLCESFFCRSSRKTTTALVTTYAPLPTCQIKPLPWSSSKGHEVLGHTITETSRHPISETSNIYFEMDNTLKRIFRQRHKGINSK